MFGLSFTSILRENTLVVIRGLPPPSINLTRGLAGRWLFRESPCHKGTIQLQTSKPSPGFELSPYGIVVDSNSRSSLDILHKSKKNLGILKTLRHSSQCH
ncbi:hypothetical protein TNCV_1860781 [Trichonephila clavipes]|nr:hypothetical protein TNCV_1860781 [Trichonephila clavipes]